MAKEKNTTRPYKIVLPTEGTDVELIILDTNKDQILYWTFDEAETLAENFITAIQHAKQCGIKLTELQIQVKKQ